MGVVEENPQSPSRASGDDRADVDAPSIRLIAVDLDGTLLDDSKTVSRQTVDAFACLPPGVRVVIASARPPRSVRHIYEKLKLSTWQINYNGALIWDEPNKAVIHHIPMEAAAVRQIVDVARDMFEEVLVSCEVLDRWYTDRKEQPYTTQTGLIFKPDLIAPLDQIIVQPVTKLMLLGEPRLVSRLEPILLERFPDIGMVRSDGELLQIMDRHASKAAAVEIVAEFYGVPMNQVMAIGDEMNDVSMLKAAGVAIAMDNAHPDVKAVADWVAPSNNDHGVHAAMVRYGLCR